jgi:hypothetical protein
MLYFSGHTPFVDIYRDYRPVNESLDHVIFRDFSRFNAVKFVDLEDLAGV